MSSLRSRTAALAVALALSSRADGFTLPPAQRVRASTSSIRESNDVAVPFIKSEGEATSIKDLSLSSSHEIADESNGESSPATILEDSIPPDLTIGALEEATEPWSAEWSEKNDVGLDDIVRDLDGNPLTAAFFAEKMGVPVVDSYSCPEKDVFRGFMSNACRVRLSPGGETAFYKSVVFEELEHAREKLRNSPDKLARDAESYRVVASFLSSRACERVTEKAGVHIPKCYDAQSRPDNDNPINSKFSFLFEDIAPWNGWYQQWLLQDGEECRAALTTLAKIHAFFWEGSSFWDDEDAGKELEGAVWASGSYVQPKAQGYDQYERVASEWATKRLKFEEELSSLDYWDNLGERLQSVAEECGRLAHPFADDALSKECRKYRTFTHGDPKQANLFFRRSPESDELQVGVIDFQWTGFGLAATDVAHFLSAAVHADILVDGGEETYMRYYYDELQKYLVEYGAFDNSDDVVQSFSYATFAEQYDTAFLDICRLVIAYTWARFTEPVEKDDEVGCARTMNKTSYNKSLPNVVWLTKRCDEILRSRGA